MSIEVMKQALEYIERHAIIDGIPVRDALRQAIEQAEQPMMTKLANKVFGDIEPRMPDFSSTAPTAPAQPSNHTEQPLDMVKAQQPLPDKQIEELAEWYGLEHMDYEPFARAIEQAHGIKGASL